ncbi:MAG: GNAT family N-acetyltransferase [Arcicella sp.]|nr:GNAT family N-acetyltransferase [Arcicella sp.]
MEITYQTEPNLSVAEFRDLLVRSTLGERRPIDEPEHLEKMCKNADIILTARFEGKLVGISRSLSDFAFATYLSDLAVDTEFQHVGIGKRLIAETKKLVPDGKLILLAAPAARGYYPKIGMIQFEYAFYIDNLEELKL